MMGTWEIAINDTSFSEWFIISTDYLSQDSALSITVEDDIGCIYTENVNVFVSSNISVFPQEQLVDSQNILLLNPVGGVSPYTIQWGDLSIGESFVLSLNGWVNYEITDQLGCTFSGSYYYQSGNGVNEIDRDCYVYLDKDRLFCTDCQNCNYRITTLNGSLIQRGFVENDIVNVENLAGGFYLIQIEDKVFKIVKY